MRPIEIARTAHFFLHVMRKIIVQCELSYVTVSGLTTKARILRDSRAEEKREKNLFAPGFGISSGKKV